MVLFTPESCALLNLLALPPRTTPATSCIEFNIMHGSAAQIATQSPSALSSPTPHKKRPDKNDLFTPPQRSTHVNKRASTSIHPPISLIFRSEPSQSSDPLGSNVRADRHRPKSTQTGDASANHVTVPISSIRKEKENSFVAYSRCVHRRSCD